MLDRAVSAFHSIYQTRPTAAALAPGRVEILGNHTDYNGGSVLAAAIDRHICMVGAPRDGNRVRVHSLDFDQNMEFELPDGSAPPPARIGVDWADLIRAALFCLAEADVQTVAFDGVVVGNIPIAAGLSSSAALTVGTAILARQLAGAARRCSSETRRDDLPGAELARLMQEAEHVGLGVRCGLLDPYTSIHGRLGALIALDAARGIGRAVPLAASADDAPAIVIVDSRTPRTLAASRYNHRRSECELVARQIAGALGKSFHFLCEVTSEEFARVESRLEETPRRRAQHILGEDARVRAAVEALQAGDVARVGWLMRESHSSSRVNFENSTERLDLICEVADRRPGCLGSRLSGAGWGGCTVHLVKREAGDEFTHFVTEEVLRLSGAPVEAYVTQASDGARGLTL